MTRAYQRIKISVNALIKKALNKIQEKNLLEFLYESYFDGISGKTTDILKQYIHAKIPLDQKFVAEIAQALQEDVRTYIMNTSLIKIIDDVLKFVNNTLKFVTNITNITIKSFRTRMFEILLKPMKKLASEVWDWKEECEIFYKSIQNQNKIFGPYVSLNAADELRQTYLYIVTEFYLRCVLPGHTVLLIQIFGFAVMAGTEAFWFYFYPGDYQAMLFDASLQLRAIYPYDPNIIYNIENIEKLLSLPENLPENIDLNEISKNIDTSTASQTKPKKFDYIYNSVFQMGVFVTTAVLFCCLKPAF